MTMQRSTLLSLSVLLAGGALAGCRDTPLAENVDANNKSPIAHAGEMQMFDYSGSPVSVTLDGSGSSDADGRIVSYRWLSGLDAPDGGIGRGGIDPEDVVSPTVSLDAGTWEFVLFVTDDEGGVSRPATVTVQVGSGLPPEVIECRDMAASVIAEECKLCVCGVDETCRELFVACDEACWAFYTCVEQNCGDLTHDPADMDALVECTTSTCMDFFGGVGPWIPLETCVRREPCGTICSDSVQPM